MPVPSNSQVLPLRVSSEGRDSDCVAFLQWALPHLGLRWRGFRSVRGQVCKRLSRRLRELGLPDLAAYRAYLLHSPPEWQRLDGFCRITVSRFYRDREVFDALADAVLPRLAALALANGESALRCWSAGCAAGEEPYTLAIIWERCMQIRFPQLTFSVTATDADAAQLCRARQGCYAHSSLKELPAHWLAQAFVHTENGYCIRSEHRAHVSFLAQDIRTTMPPGPFHLVLCRNLAFTYFDQALQEAVLAGIVGRLCAAGVLVIGMHERLPMTADELITDAGKEVHVLPTG